MTLARVTTWADGNTLTAAALNGEFDNIINNPTALFSVVTDRLLGRDAAGTGNVEQISVTNGLAFTGGTAIGISNAGVTYARIQDVTAASRLLGRGSAAGSGDVEEITMGTGLSISATSVVSGARSVMQFDSSAVVGGVTVFMGNGGDTTEFNVCRPSPVSGTIERMTTAASASPVGVQSYTYTLRVGSSYATTADTAITHAVSGTAALGNSTGSVAVTAGQILNIKMVASLTAATARHQASISILTTA